MAQNSDSDSFKKMQKSDQDANKKMSYNDPRVKKIKKKRVNEHLGE